MLRFITAFFGWGTRPVEIPDDDPTPPMQRAWDSAFADVGKREDKGNTGEYLEYLRKLVGLFRKAGGEWCAVFISAHLFLAGIFAKSRGAPGVVRALARLPRGRYVKIDDIEPGFIGICYRKRGRNRWGKMTHHTQFLRAFMTEDGMRIQHVGGNERNEVRAKIWLPREYFKGVIQVATYE